MPVHRAGGYQGEDSVHTRALRHLLDTWQQAEPTLRADFTADVTKAGQTARALFDGIEAGHWQLGYMASGYLVARVPELRALDAPFAVRDRQAMLDSLDGPLGRQLASAVARQTQLRVLAFWDNGFRHISNRLHPIVGVADCAGMRIRTLDSASYVQTFEALGFEPVVTDASELRAAVASGHVAAQENPLVNFMQFDVWRHHRFVSLTHHLFGVALLVAPAAWIDAMPGQQRLSLLAAARLATTFQRGWAVASEAQALAQAEACGVQVVREAELHRQQFVDATSALRQAALAAGAGLSV